jgi:hypothetical protein
MFLGGAGFHNSGGRTRAPSWCKVMRSDMEILICIRVRTCQTWDSLVFSLVQHAISDHSEALFTLCSRILVIIIWPIAVDMILSSIIHLLGFKISHWWLWRLPIFWVRLQCRRVNTIDISEEHIRVEELAARFMLISYLLTLRPWWWMRYVPPKRQLAFTAIYLRRQK